MNDPLDAAFGVAFAHQQSAADALREAAKQRILVLDGAMGTQIQALGLTETHFRGERFIACDCHLQGNNDLLTLTQPKAIEDIHFAYAMAGADILETNTFSSTSIAQADYGMQEAVYDLNRDGARLARRAAIKAEKADGRRRFVAGALGPTNRTASLSPDVNNPGYRAVTFDDLRIAYGEQIRGLIDGGADLILIETIFDTLNAKAAIFACEEIFAERGIRLPLMISGTITDRSGRTLSGQTPTAFWHSVRHARPFTVGLNCALGASAMREHLEEISGAADAFVCAYPNAGLPNAFGQYDESPEAMAAEIGGFARDGLVNIVGGCCGSTPDHIRAIAEAVRNVKPRAIPTVEPLMRLSGLEPFTLTSDIPFVNIGERTNVTGSAKFRKLITAGDFAGALAVARDQVANGAQIIDVNMDEGLIDSEAAMIEFLNLVASEPDIARVPVMVNSSKFRIIEAGLKCLQGKSLVNSISMKEGEEEFLRQARLVRAYGAAVVVMAFDEQGQADTFERKVSICARAYKLLTEKAGFPPEDIVFDPNIFAVATGIEEHNGYGVAFIEATRRIRTELPHAHISGGVSNLSFSFRGNEPVREAMHAVFLYHAIQAGMDMGIVNAGQLAVYDEIDPELREACEDVVLNRRADATERLLAVAERFRGAGGKEAKAQDLAWRDEPVDKRIAHALVNGITDYIEADTEEARLAASASARRDRGPADGGHERRRRPVRRRKNVPAAGGQVGAGDEAGGGDAPALHGGREGGGRRRPPDGRHDRARDRQGRRARHRQEHRRRRARLQQLRDHRSRRHDAGLEDPRGRARAEGRRDRPFRPHHALARRDGACRGRDGARGLRHPAADRRRDDEPRPHRGEDPSALRARADGPCQRREPRGRRRLVAAVARDARRDDRGGARRIPQGRRGARAQRSREDADAARQGARQCRADRLERLSPDDAELPRHARLRFLRSRRACPLHRLDAVLPDLGAEGPLSRDPRRSRAGRGGAQPVRRRAGDAEADRRGEMARAEGGGRLLAGGAASATTSRSTRDEQRKTPIATLHTLRQQLGRRDGRPNVALADFVGPPEVRDYVGAFVVTAGVEDEAIARRFERANDDYSSILVKALADRFAEAFAEAMHARVRRELWGYAPDESFAPEELIAEPYRGIRPAPGYPAQPDHTEKATLFRLLDAERAIGVRLTESFAMWPASSVSGVYIAHPEAHYFGVAKVERDQVEDYAARKGMGVAEVERWLAPVLNYVPIRAEAAE